MLKEDLRDEDDVCDESPGETHEHLSDEAKELEVRYGVVRQVVYYSSGVGMQGLPFGNKISGAFGSGKFL